MVTDGFRNRNQTENGKTGFAIPTMQAQVTLLCEKTLAKREKLLWSIESISKDCTSTILPYQEI